MLIKKIKYTDYNGVEREETFYFNLNKAELMEMELGTTGGFVEKLQKIISAQDAPSILKVFKDIVLKAYGEKSDDGRRLIKSEELSTAFAQTEAYSELFMELTTNESTMAEFINGIMPAEAQQLVK